VVRGLWFVVCGLWFVAYYLLAACWSLGFGFDQLSQLCSCAIRGVKKHEVLARLKAANARRALFFCACVGMSLANNISARFFSPRGVGGPAQRLQAGVRQREQVTRGTSDQHPTPALDFFRAISAGECLLVSTVALCGAKLNSLTPLGPVVLPLLKNSIAGYRITPVLVFWT
jgi:hypothetical protein